MASSPVTGERRPSVQGFRRSSSQFASIPQRSLSVHERAALDKADAAAEVLYSHPKVRIYKFEPPTDAIKNSKAKTLPEADYPIDAIEVLPWRSHRELLANTGQMIIEKVRGSSNFLKAGSLINTIMRNSQCWCVDGESKFVMRVGNFKYQRLEFPINTEEERQKVDEFKTVIGKLLKYESTPCPFIRAFHVSLPEDAITPRRKGPWKRTDATTPTTPDDELEVLRLRKTSRAWSFKAAPPSSFPTRSFTYNEPERPRTATASTNKTRFSIGRGTDSPISYNSGDDASESEKHDSGSERPESNHNSEVDESDKEHPAVPIIKSPLHNVEILSPTVDDKVRDFEQLKHQALPEPVLRARPVRRQSDSTPHVPSPHAEPSPSPPPADDEKLANNPVDVVDLVDAAGAVDTADAVDTVDAVDAVGVDDSIDAIGATEATEHTIKDVKEPIKLDRLEIPQNDADAHEELQSDDDGQVSPVSTLYNQLLESVSSPPPELRFTSMDDDLPDIQPLNAPDQEEEEELRAARDELPPTPPSPDAVDKVMASRIGLQALKRLEFKYDLDDANYLTNGSVTDTPKQRSVQGEESCRSRTPISPSAFSDGHALAQTLSNEDAMSTVSNDSFHTLVSEVPDVDEDLVQRLNLPLRPQHRRDVSDITITASQTNEAIATDTQQQDEIRMTAPEENEIRRRLRGRRSLSPLPSSTNIAVGPMHEQGSTLPSDLVRQAVKLAVVKPIEIVLFVVQILTRIAQGATVNDLISGELFRQPGTKRTASGTSDRSRQKQTRGRSRDSNEGRVTTNEEDEDDYGLPLRRKSSAKESPALAIKKRSGSVRDEDAVSFAGLD